MFLSLDNFRLFFKKVGDLNLLLPTQRSPITRRNKSRLAFARDNLTFNNTQRRKFPETSTSKPQSLPSGPQCSSKKAETSPSELELLLFEQRMLGCAVAPLSPQAGFFVFMRKSYKKQKKGRQFTHPSKLRKYVGCCD